MFASSIEAGSIKLGPFTIDEGGMLAGPASEGMTLSQDMILFTKDNGKRTGIGDVYDSNLEGVGGYFKIVLSSANCHTAGAGAVTVITSGGLPVSGIRQIGLSVYTSNGASDYALDLKGRIRIGGQKAFTGTWSITDPWSNIKSITFQDGLVVSCV